MKIEKKITLSFFLTGIILGGIVFVLPNWFVLIPLISAAAGYCVSKIISRPICRLCEGVEIIRAGRLDYKTRVKTKDEIGVLSKTFDEITDDLEKTTSCVEELNRENESCKKARQDLKEQEEYYRKLFELSNDAVFLYNFDGKIIDANDKAREMLGYAKEELLNMSFFDLHTKKEWARPKEAFKTEPETCSVRFESKFKNKENGEIYVDISSSVVDISREIMQAIVRDVTKRKELEKELKESEEKFRTFMETASDLMQIMDKNGKFVYVNEAMVKVLNYSREELTKMRVADILESGASGNLEDIQKRLIKEGTITRELTWLTKEGREVLGEMKLASIYGPKGKYLGARGVFRDVTERKKVEESQRLAQLGKLVSDMTHEVRNPLTVITARAQLSMMEGEKAADIQKNLKIIVNQCGEARDIIQRLLKFSRPSKKEMKEVDINENIKSIIELMEHIFLLKQIKIKKMFASKPLLAKIDEKQIQEVFMNLLRNSAEAMPEGGIITISTKEENGFVRIDCADTGSGIAESDMKKIFDPFFTTKENGTGLGLSVCYGIIKAHEGTLKYTSPVGKGTTATVILPFASKNVKVDEDKIK
ncbi:MAG: PAS domain S-box protein [Candidatus Omnitrophota bacterium]